MQLNLKRLALLTGPCARAFAARAALTPQRIDVMLVARRYAASFREIAAMLCVSPPVVSRMVAALSELGLVYVEVDPRDRRRRVPRLTEAGRARLALCFPSPTRRGAQTTGELEWLSAWRSTLTSLKIRIDSVFRGYVPRFAGFAAWAERYRAERRRGRGAAAAALPSQSWL